jgi:hypothetical protein
MSTPHQHHSDQQDNPAQDLQEVFSTAEISKLDTFAEGLQRLQAQPARSSSAKHAGWQVLESAIESESSRLRWPGLWKITAIPALGFFVMLTLLLVAQTALPGDTTYGLKRGTENLQLTLASSDAKKADMCSMLMKRRANELAQLPAGTKNTDQVLALTASIKEEATEFSEFADKAGTSKAQLRVQRSRDAQYVVEALKISQTQQTDSGSQRAISNAIVSMSTIVKSS